MVETQVGYKIIKFVCSMVLLPSVHFDDLLGVEHEDLFTVIQLYDLVITV